MTRILDRATGPLGQILPLIKSVLLMALSMITKELEIHTRGMLHSIVDTVHWKSLPRPVFCQTLVKSLSGDTDG